MKEIISNYKSEFEQYFNEKKHCLDSVVEPLKSGMLYALDGGKRLRPILCMFGADFMSATHSSVMHIAFGLECIHNYSLCHDDLPCMDDDDLRHGKPSTHIVFGEGMGVLIGDALLNYAFEYMLSKEDINPNYIKAIKYISNMAGVNGMVGGQCIDIQNVDNSKKELSEIILLNMLKTACLFKGALVGSAISLGANDSEILDLEQYAEKIGLIFQIVDDILDVTSSSEIMGKNVGSDEKSCKTTYLSIVGMDRAKQDIAKLENEAIDIMKKYGDRGQKLIEFAKFLTNRVY